MAEEDNILEWDTIISVLRAMLAIFIVAWFLNFTWESFHGPFLYRMGEHLGIVTHQKFVPIIAWVSVKDAALVLVFYAVFGAIYRDILWVNQATLNRLSLLLGLGVVTAAGIEYHAITTGRWMYSDLMPLVFGIGLSPLLQLGVTGALSVKIAHWLLYKKI